ncbi:hypothetical protein JYG23_09025 [Sedimentibacter sp. zth1]|uniref:AAA family ATPase n=1 Tax=Sedimentibacter sp. zth1 TaxID=2816908 RepID=UPI001A90EB1A|nr:hypothetical protein [Sedimentibacter sp. zth1]QSX04845.1 hypothetical protein JYG23_09025 [Sedimentibacter sp. zth1]
MKIRIAMIDSDKVYANRFFECMNNNFSDKVEIHIFSNEESFKNNEKNKEYEVLLLQEHMLENLEDINKDVVFINLVDTLSKKEAGQNQIYKYQKISLIYKEILNYYSEKYTIIKTNLTNNIATRVITFMSCDSSSGTSTLASSFSIKLSKNFKVLYLDLQSFPTVKCFFEAEGKFNLSDIIYAIKSNNVDISTRIESTVKRDKSDVYFISSCKNSLERNEVTKENIEILINNVLKYINYDYIVIDIDYQINPTCNYLLDISDNIIFSKIPTEQCNTKFSSIVNSINLIQNINDKNYMSKCCIIYNKINDKNTFKDEMANAKDMKELTILGYLEEYKNISSKKLAELLSNNPIFDSLCK